jgi:hypothetical protein
MTLSKKIQPPDAYAENTREPIRDETIRSGLIPCNAVVERKGCHDIFKAAILPESVICCVIQ